MNEWRKEFELALWLAKQRGQRMRVFSIHWENPDGAREHLWAIEALDQPVKGWVRR